MKYKRVKEYGEVKFRRITGVSKEDISEDV